MTNKIKLNTSLLIVTLVGFILCGFILTGSTLAQDTGTPDDGVPEVGVEEHELFLLGEGLRVGVVAYCTDLLGEFGAINTFQTLVDDGRFGTVVVVDGDAGQPSTDELLARFDCVITMSDSRCGDSTVLDEAGEVLAGYAQAGRGLVISTFGFAFEIGFGPSLFAPGLSPFQRVSSLNGDAGPVNVAGAADSPPACARMLSGVGPFSSDFSNFVDLSAGASLCTSYDNGELFLAVNEDGNVIGLNTFPADEDENLQLSYQLMVSNAVFEACSVRVSRPIPTLSEWGLLALAIVLGALGLFAVRRRNMAAQG